MKPKRRPGWFHHSVHGWLPRDIKGGRLPPDAATRDHLDHRLSGERGKHPGQVRSVLACPECNQQRGAEFEASMPIERLRQLSGRQPRGVEDGAE